MSSGIVVDYATLTVADSAVGLDSASPALPGFDREGRLDYS